MTHIFRSHVVLPTFIAILALMMAALPSSVPAAPVTAGAQDFIQSIANETVSVLQDESLQTDQRTERLGALFNRHFAVEEIAQFVLGRHWRTASESERETYVELFRDFIVFGYAQRFGDFAGERLRVRGASAVDDNTAIVNSEIVRPGQQSNVRVDWRVMETNGSFQIHDVVVEGVSMAQTQRSDFAATIRQRGSVAGLNQALQQKVTQLRQQLGLTG